MNSTDTEVENIYEIAQLIKETRVALKLSQQDVAEYSGVNRAWLSRFETGNVSGVTYLTIERLLKTLKIKLMLVPTLTHPHQS